jgi:hypothetical protein
LDRIGFRAGLASWEWEKHSPERDTAAALLRKRRHEIRFQW